MIYVPIETPVRHGLDFETRWQGEDRGLIYCWERGRELGAEKPELARKTEMGELPMLCWKGGVEKKLQGKQVKHGSLQYLATWQGLRGESLEIALEKNMRSLAPRPDRPLSSSESEGQPT